MSEENKETPMSVEDALNLLVNAARQLKLNYTEHQTVDKAVQILLTELNKKETKVKKETK